MKVLRKIWKFLSSMTFAVILLVLLVVACAVGSFVKQGQTFDWYAASYSETAAAWIMALRLNDTFHSWWFIAITAFLCGNLLLCNVFRLGTLIMRTKSFGDAGNAAKRAADASVSGVSDPESVFAALRMPKPQQSETDGIKVLYSSKHRIGLWGAWVCHIGILLLILGFGLGQMTKQEYSAYGVPGQTRPIGDTGLFLSINDFRIDLRDDDTVEQYTADVTVWRVPQGSTTEPDEQRAVISVNHPGRMFGMTFYQNATGWAAKVDVTKSGEPLQSEIVCAGEYLPIADKKELVVYFNAFYPDYALVPGEGPKTVSGRLNRPAYLYSVYYLGELLGMNALTQGETITIDDYEVSFSEPQNYTLIQIKRDAFTSVAFAGGVVTMIGLLLAFYILPQSVWAMPAENGTWTVYAESKKRRAMLRDELERAVSATKLKITGETDAQG